jgi:hypothetical protein
MACRAEAGGDANTGAGMKKGLHRVPLTGDYVASANHNKLPLSWWTFPLPTTSSMTRWTFRWFDPYDTAPSAVLKLATGSLMKRKRYVQPHSSPSLLSLDLDFIPNGALVNINLPRIFDAFII